MLATDQNSLLFENVQEIHESYSPKWRGQLRIEESYTPSHSPSRKRILVNDHRLSELSVNSEVCLARWTQVTMTRIKSDVMTHVRDVMTTACFGLAFLVDYEVNAYV